MINLIPASAEFQVDGTYTELLTRGEKPYSLFDGKVVLIEGFATWCDPCREEFNQLNTVYNHFKGNLTIMSLSISPGTDDLNDIKIFKEEVEKEYNFNAVWEIGLDHKSDFVNKFPVGFVPSTFLFTADGDLEKKWVGAVIAEEIISYIDANVSLNQIQQVSKFTDILLNNVLFQLTTVILVLTAIFRLFVPKVKEV